MMNTDAPEPPRSQYILAWILASIPSNMLGRVVGMVAYRDVHSMDQVVKIYLMTIPVTVVGVTLIYLAVYSYFPGIVFAKVVPWLWGLGAVGLAITLFTLNKPGVTFPPVFFALTVADFVVTMLAIMWAFRRRGRL